MSSFFLVSEQQNWMDHQTDGWFNNGNVTRYNTNCPTILDITIRKFEFLCDVCRSCEIKELVFASKKGHFLTQGKFKVSIIFVFKHNLSSMCVILSKERMNQLFNSKNGKKKKNHMKGCKIYFWFMTCLFPHMNLQCLKCKQSFKQCQNSIFVLIWRKNSIWWILHLQSRVCKGLFTFRTL